MGNHVVRFCEMKWTCKMCLWPCVTFYLDIRGPHFSLAFKSSLGKWLTDPSNGRGRTRAAGAADNDTKHHIHVCVLCFRREAWAVERGDSRWTWRCRERVAVSWRDWRPRAEVAESGRVRNTKYLVNNTPNHYIWYAKKLGFNHREWQQKSAKFVSK